MSILLGVLLMIGGFSCLFTPLLTFLGVGHCIVIFIMIFGIFGIVKSFREKRFGLDFVFSIISTIFGICALIVPQLTLVSDAVWIYLTAAWFVLLGIVSIIASIKVTKSTGSKIWIVQLIFGILDIIIGGYSFFHPLVLALTMGILISIYFIETGLTMLISGIAFASQGEN